MRIKLTRTFLKIIQVHAPTTTYVHEDMEIRTTLDFGDQLGDRINEEELKVEKFDFATQQKKRIYSHALLRETTIRNELLQ